ncbi:chemotaxis protein CheW [Halanaerobaculum tunisiense]
MHNYSDIVNMSKIVDTNQFIVFQIGEQKFAIKITEGQEIIKPQEVTALPRSAKFIKGIIEC